MRNVTMTVIFLSVGIVAISFAAIFIRLCGDVPAIMIATYRLVGASCVLFIVFFVTGHSLRAIHPRDVVLSVVAGVFLSLHFITWIASLKYTSVASSVVLVTTNPIFVGFFSWIFLRERQRWTLVAGIILCCAGGALIAVGDGGWQGLVPANSLAVRGDLLALAGAVMASGYLIVGSRLRVRMDVISYTTIVYGMSAVILLVISLLIGLPFTGYRPQSYLYLVLLAVVPQLIGHTAINWALKHVRASMVAIAILGEPVGATSLAWFFFREAIGTIQLVGIISIFGAIIIASRHGWKVPASSDGETGSGTDTVGLLPS